MMHVSHYERRFLADQFESIGEMQASVNDLLNSMLPPHVVTLVHQGMSPIAEQHDNVSIIFTDIKGFTAYSSVLTPGELMQFLNSMYSAFDEVIMNWDLYKVEVIGDAYCISSGCPVAQMPWPPQEAAMRAVEVALALLRTMTQVCNDSSVQMRIGVHSGPVVAGVVGRKGPRFHCFGPTVVYAEKMESHGEPGRVHISNATYNMLQKGGYDYKTEDRVGIPVDGVSTLQRTWFVNKSDCKEASKLQRSLIVQRRKESEKVRHQLALSSDASSRSHPHGPELLKSDTALSSNSLSTQLTPHLKKSLSLRLSATDDFDSPRSPTSPSNRQKLALPKGVLRP